MAVTDDSDSVLLIERGLVERDRDRPLNAKRTCSACGVRGHDRRASGKTPEQMRASRAGWQPKPREVEIVAKTTSVDFCTACIAAGFHRTGCAEAPKS